MVLMINGFLEFCWRHNRKHNRSILQRDVTEVRNCICLLYGHIEIFLSKLFIEVCSDDKEQNPYYDSFHRPVHVICRPDFHCDVTESDKSYFFNNRNTFPILSEYRQLQEIITC